MLKKGKEITAFLVLALMLSGCGGENEESHANAITAASESVQSSWETVNHTETVISQALTEAVVTEDLSEETENGQPIDNSDKLDFDDFKNNVVVIGDSIALGYGAYERLPMNHVFAKLNASPSKMDDFKFEYAGGEAAALTILNELQPDFIMLSMGLNDITTYSAEAFTEKYKDFTGSILESCPQSEIYIMGLTPVKSDCEYTSNKNIDEYNIKLSEVFGDYNEKIHFVNAGKVLKNENGSLNMDYSGGDGIHLSGAAYDEMLEELKNYMYNK